MQQILIYIDMKTNVTMQSLDRNLMGSVIRQETKTEFMCLTDLQNAYDNVRVKNGWKVRRVDSILASSDNAERVYYILKKRGYIKDDITIESFIKFVEENSLVKALKKFKAYKSIGARENRRVMCDPYVWVLVAMEMNPELYAEVVMWLTDQLLLNRIEAGNNYNRLSRAIARFNNPDYSLMAKGLNYIVFNKHEAVIRNKGTKEQLKELDKLQTALCFSIDMGYIKTFDQLIETMRDIYREKYMHKKKLV